MSNDTAQGHGWTKRQNHVRAVLSLTRVSEAVRQSRTLVAVCGFLTQILERGARSWPRRMRATRKRILSLLLLLSLYSAQTLRDEKSIRPGAGGRRYTAARAIGHNILSAGGGAYGVRPIASRRLIRFARLRRQCCTKAATMGRTISSSSKMLCSHKNWHCEYQYNIDKCSGLYIMRCILQALQ